MDIEMFRTRALRNEATRQPDTKSAPIQKTQTGDPVLLLLHQKTSCAGAVGNWLKSQGYELDIRRATLGEKLPQTLEKHAGIIVFGGPMSANDDIPEIKKEIDWLTLALQEKVPYFGICLGAQMMIRQLGGKVSLHKKGLVEIGYHPVEATQEGKKLVNEWPDRCFQWHKEGFDLPSGTVALAKGRRFKNQAFSYENHVFGVQFHPEITERIIKRWSTSASHMLTKKGAHIAERLLADHQKFGDAQLDWLHHFMSHWTSLFKTK
jgi:GMP synthase (glutamine-hydrolysing)